ncbi:MAG TPA: trypsin-like peptidase domain-containing protein [Chloroflexia bacterium]|nr:trypsin-like peptidase domain-containing protein [Chloroflexia bacterium]
MDNVEKVSLSLENNLLRSLSNHMADAVERISPALVVVNGRQRQPATGIVFAPNLVLTADHVLEREEDLTVVTHDKRTLPAQFVGRDISSDLAVLRVADLNVEKAALSADAPRVGQLILAVGRPSPEGPMASIGIISAVGGPLRTRQGVTLDRFLQTDAIPYPGFSGGPLIDSEGAVVGVMSTGVVASVALGVPATDAWRIAETLSQQGFIKRGFLGISSQPVELPASQRAGRSQETGLLIVRVEENSPASRGGLMVGDILVSLDGQPASDAEDIQALLTGDRVGKTVAVEVIRGGAAQTLQVTIGQRG